MNNQIKKILEGTASVLPISDLEKKIQSGKELIIKLGADPTAPNLHLGHAVVLDKLRDLQNLGHQIVFLIGDFTARIGDPTGKSKTRPPLSEEQILENTKTYVSQIGRILDMSKTKIVYNSHWFDKLTSRDWINICGKVTLARIIERDDFSKRLANNSPIGFHELLYPLLQAYDSVHLKADVEVGGTDQTFNLIMGRFLQESMNLESQVVITMPILEGLDGVEKMSKSLKNDIGLTEQPENVFGKIMSISDEAMWKYYKVLLRYSDEEIEEIKNKIHPIENKKNLAYLILKRYWSNDDAEKGKLSFEDKFQNKKYDTANIVNLDKNNYLIIDLIIILDNSLSRSEVRRLLSAGAISINDEKILSDKLNIDLKINDIIKVGKHKIYKINF